MPSLIRAISKICAAGRDIVNAGSDDLNSCFNLFAESISHNINEQELETKVEVWTYNAIRNFILKRARAPFIVPLKHVLLLNHDVDEEYRQITSGIVSGRIRGGKRQRSHLGRYSEMLDALAEMPSKESFDHFSINVASQEKLMQLLTKDDWDIIRRSAYFQIHDGSHFKFPEGFNLDKLDGMFWANHGFAIIFNSVGGGMDINYEHMAEAFNGQIIRPTTNLSLESAWTIVERWHTNLEKVEDDKKKKKSMEMSKNLVEGSDFEVVPVQNIGHFTWRRLLSDKSLEVETLLMRNCVSTYKASVANGRSLIYSLWDADNPHITVEVITETKCLAQVEGMSNSNPKEVYLGPILALIQHLIQKGTITSVNARGNRHDLLPPSILNQLKEVN